MTTRLDEQEKLTALEARLKTLLPEEYQDSYEDVQPVSMGSAGLKYGTDGQVAWDDMWDSFCDLAMAGGPPHKGKLLEPGSRAEIEAQPERYQPVVAEICRGVGLVTGLPVQPSPNSGWVRVTCESPAMAEWLLRAIVMENVLARSEGTGLDLPAGPAYRVEKEIKNVITVIAKTCHYWLDHMFSAQQRAIGDLFTTMAVESPLIQPALAGDDGNADSHQSLSSTMAAAIHQETGLASSNHAYPGWLGLSCLDVRAAVWMMRALVASNVLARREETTLFVPVNAASDPNGDTVVRAMVGVHGFARARGIL